VHYDEGKRGQRGESESCIVSFGKHGEVTFLEITLSGSKQNVVRLTLQVGSIISKLRTCCGSPRTSTTCVVWR
jgi:hypothetical protein